MRTRIEEFLWKIRGFDESLIYRQEEALRFQGGEDGVSPPYGEVLLFRQKDPKPCWPWHGPLGTLRGSPTPEAGKLAALRHCPPFYRCRLHCSAMPPGQGISEGKRTNSQGSHKVRSMLRASLLGASRQASNYRRRTVQALP